MRKFTAALMAAAMVLPTMAAPAMAAPQHHDDKGHASKQASYHSFKKGEKFDKSRARDYREVDYRKYKKLKAPPRGYHYVRSGNDILLVGITSGIVASVLAGAFN